MAISALHHWGDACERGARELVRLARERAVIINYDAAVSGAIWLMTDYLPAVAELDRAIFPAPEQIAGWLGGDAEIETVPIPRDTPDYARLVLCTPRARPRCVGSRSDPGLRADVIRDRLPRRPGRGSGSARLQLRRTACALRQLEEHDAGLRLIVARVD